MVAKISRGNSLFGALAYNHSKVDLDLGEVLLSNRIIPNLEGDIDLQSTLQSFNLHLLKNRQTEKPIVHISLNPHPDDVLSNEQFREIAQEYMEKMGFGKQPYVVYKHNDIDRAHIHIVTTNVDADGRKLDHNKDFYRSKQITRELESKYGLRPAEKKSRTERQTFTFGKVDVSKGNVKMQIANIIKPLAATYKFQSLGEYRTLLSLYNISVEEAKGKRGGKEYEGLIYYATNDKGEKISNPFKSSLFGKTVGYKFIQSKCEKHKQTIKEKQFNKQTAKRINNATINMYDQQKFIDVLKANNIDVVLRVNDTGRIYGVTFIDHNNQCIFNGSRLGREFSANAINERFNHSPLNDEAENLKHQESIALANISLGGLFDLPADGGDDPEEARFRKRMQRKNKKSPKL